MAVAMAGVQSVFTAAYDEAFAIPTELAAKTALRVQQIVAYETDVAATVDPLAGSYFVEKLTDDMERAISSVMEEIERRGGMVECLRSGYVQRRIGERAYEWQRKLESGEVVVPGVNKFVTETEPAEVEVHRVPLELEREQVARLRSLRSTRDEAAAHGALARLEEEARGNANLMPAIVAAVRAYATVGEITTALRRTFGTYMPPEF
jgi:methylmalonyl-CoA mutase N-terminal domain/subunit